VKYEPEASWRWRIRAEDLRMRAEITRDPQSRITFLMLAESWDAKATRAEHEPVPTKTVSAKPLAPRKRHKRAPGRDVAHASDG
jgi:hypothetical protein